MITLIQLECEKMTINIQYFFYSFTGSNMIVACWAVNITSIETGIQYSRVDKTQPVLSSLCNGEAQESFTL